MRTNIDIDDELMEEAQRLAGPKTKKALVEEGLQALIRQRGKKKILISRARSIGSVISTNFEMAGSSMIWSIAQFGSAFCGVIELLRWIESARLSARTTMFSSAI